MRPISEFVRHPKDAVVRFMEKSGLPHSDKLFCKIKYRLVIGRKLDLRHPALFSEKLQWLKIYDHRDIYHKMVDKYECKALIDNTIGGGYSIPTLGVWDCFEDIDWQSLPAEFVLKATHDSGSYYICTDKGNMDMAECKRRLYKNWKQGWYKRGREWQYKGLKPRIIAEPLLRDSVTPYLRDFKVYCFNGEPRVMYITSGRGEFPTVKEDFFDMQGNHLDLQDAHYGPNPTKAPDLPENLKLMVKLARKLAKNLYHLRVDFYEIDGKVYVGELTLHDGAGFVEFKPNHWNRTLGDWLRLPTDRG